MGKMGSYPLQSLLLSVHKYPLVVVLIQRWLISAYQFIVFTRSWKKENVYTLGVFFVITYWMRRSFEPKLNHCLLKLRIHNEDGHESRMENTSVVTLRLGIS